MSAPRLDRLTSVRFVAAVAVIVCHVALIIDDHVTQQVTARLGTGVPFFFVLSGFVLTWGYRPGASATGFWRKRFARVYPLHVISWAGAIFLMYELGHRTQALHNTLLSLFLLHAWTPVPATHFASNGVSWTLSTEAFLYLCFPLAVRLLYATSSPRRWRLVVACSTWILLDNLLVPFTSHNVGSWLVWIFPVTQLPIFLIGIVLALELERGWRPRLDARVSWAVFVVGAVVAYAVPEPYWRVAPLLPALTLVIVHAAVADLEDRPGPLRHPALVRLGNWTFAIYLFHGLVLNVVGHAIGHQVTWQKGLVVDVIVAVLSIAVAGVMHELVEKPLEKRLRGAPPRVELLSEHEVPVLHRSAGEDSDLGEVDGERRR
jgi:peptidoglycan/LPS O-acetylase OafA/YrhL